MPISDEVRARLANNGERVTNQDALDDLLALVPEVLLYLPGTPPSSWLLASIAPDDPDLAFGLCHVGGNAPKPGHVRLSELARMKGYVGRGVSSDTLFASATRRPLSAYLEDQKLMGPQIVLHFDVNVSPERVVI